MHNILIISIENEKIKSEEIYFTNNSNLRSFSFKRDKFFLKKLNLKDVFFFSFNISFTKQKILQKLSKLKKLKPNLSEIFIICDRDNKYLPDEIIEEKVKKIIKIIKNSNLIDNLNINKIWYLKYKKFGQKFEDFLKCHSKDLKLFKSYKKNNKNIYENTMGINGKNFHIFSKNVNHIDKNKKFIKLFSIREKKDFD